MCGTGQGVCISANRIPNVRAALCRNVEDARLARSHNNANVCGLGGRITSIDETIQILDMFISEPFEGGRH